MEITKIITENPFVDELLYCVKQLAYKCVLKDEARALANETVDSIRNGDLYIASLEKRAMFELFTYDETALRTLPLSDAQVQSCLNNIDKLPSEYKEPLRQYMMQKTINNFVETNEYYRMIMGLPPIGDPGISIANYSHLIPEGYSLELTKKLHEFDVSIASILESCGIIKAALSDYPNAKYLNYLVCGITAYDARRVDGFQILYLPTTRVKDIDNKFKAKFEQNRRYTIQTVYSEAFKLSSDYYDNFIMVFIIIQTMTDMFVEVQEHIVKKDILDARCIEFIFSCYGIPYYKEIPLKYQIAMVKNVNTLVKYKSCAKGMMNLCSLFGCDDIEIFKYFLLRDRKMDPFGDFIYTYKEKYISDNNDLIRTSRVTVPFPEYDDITIPFPFDDFLSKGNVMFISAGNTILDPTDYTIYNQNKVEFSKEWIYEENKSVDFIFYYDINTINEIYVPDKEHAVHTAYASVKGKKDKSIYEIPVPFKGYSNTGNKFILTVGSTFISSKNYVIFDDNLFFNSDIDLSQFEDRDLTFVFIYSLNDVIHYDRTDVIATENKQAIFTIPEPFLYYFSTGNKFYLTTGTTYIDNRRYTIEGNKLTILDPEYYIDKGRILTFNFIYSRNNINKTVDIKTKTINITADKYFQYEFFIDKFPIENYLEEGNKIFVKIRGSYLQEDFFEVFVDRVALKDQSIALQPGEVMTILFIYTDDRSTIAINSIDQEAKTNNQLVFDIPYPVDKFTDRGGDFIVDVNGIYYPKNLYTITNNQITILDIDDAIRLGNKVTFTFFFSKTNINNVTIKDTIIKVRNTAMKTFELRLPFYKYIEGDNGFIVLHNSVIVHPDRYHLDTDNENITFDDKFYVERDDEIVILFIYNTIYEANSRALIVDTRTVEVQNAINDELFIPIPVPFSDFIPNGYPMFVTLQDNKLYSEDNYEVMNSDFGFNNLKDITDIPILNFTFIYKSTMVRKVISEDLDKDYNLKFIKIPLKAMGKEDDYVKQKSNHLSYDTLTLSDELWDGETGLHNKVKAEILEQQFNTSREKYMSVDMIVNVSEMSFEISYFYNMFFDDVFLEENLNLRVPSITTGRNIKLNYLLCYLTSLTYLFSGIEDTIMDTPTKTMYVKGFNFKADMDAIRQYILDNRRTLEMFKDVMDFQIPKGQIPSINQLMHTFRTNKNIYNVVCTAMNECRDYDQYVMWKKIYDSLMITKFNLKFFTLADGTQAKSFKEFLKEKDKVLFNSIKAIENASNEETKQALIIDIISDAVYCLEEFIDTKEFKYIFYNLPGVSREFLLKYLFKVVNFFKSYKVQLYEMNIIYNMDDKKTNTIRPHDNMEMTIKHDQRRKVNIRDIIESLQSREFDELIGFKEKYKLAYTIDSRIKVFLWSTYDYSYDRNTHVSTNTNHLGLYKYPETVDEFLNPVLLYQTDKVSNIYWLHYTPNLGSTKVTEVISSYGSYNSTRFTYSKFNRKHAVYNALIDYIDDNCNYYTKPLLQNGNPVECLNNDNFDGYCYTSEVNINGKHPIWICSMAFSYPLDIDLPRILFGEYDVDSGELTNVVDYKNLLDLARQEVVDYTIDLYNNGKIPNYIFSSGSLELSTDLTSQVTSSVTNTISINLSNVECKILDLIADIDRSQDFLPMDGNYIIDDPNSDTNEFTFTHVIANTYLYSELKRLMLKINGVWCELTAVTPGPATLYGSVRHTEVYNDFYITYNGTQYRAAFKLYNSIRNTLDIQGKYPHSTPRYYVILENDKYNIFMSDRSNNAVANSKYATNQINMSMRIHKDWIVKFKFSAYALEGYTKDTNYQYDYIITNGTVSIPLYEPGETYMNYGPQTIRYFEDSEYIVFYMSYYTYKTATDIKNTKKMLKINKKTFKYSYILPNSIVPLADWDYTLGELNDMKSLTNKIMDRYVPS